MLSGQMRRAECRRGGNCNRELHLAGSSISLRFNYPDIERLNNIARFSIQAAIIHIYNDLNQAEDDESILTRAELS